MSRDSSPAETRDPALPSPSRSWLTEAQRKVLHVAFILLPLELLHQWLPWPRGRSEWRLLLVGAVVAAIAIDLVRLHEPRVKRFFRQFLGELIRDHEQFNLLGSTYLLLAALLAIELFTTPVAAAALGFTVLGDGFAALVGKAYGRIRLFNKSLEGTLACVFACTAWAAYLAAGGHIDFRVAMAGALVASLVELLPIPLDDNLGITLFAGYTMKLISSST